MDTCTQTIETVQKHTQEAVLNMRASVETEKLKSMNEFKKVHTKMATIHTVIDDLPTKVLQC